MEFEKFDYVNPYFWAWLMGDKLKGLNEEEIKKLWEKQFPKYKFGEDPQ